MKRMKNKMKKWMNVCREYVGKKFVQVKSESENDTLFICKVIKGKMGMTLQTKTHGCTLGNVNILIETAHLMTCVASSCQRGHNFS